VIERIQWHGCFMLQAPLCRALSSPAIRIGKCASGDLRFPFMQAVGGEVSRNRGRVSLRRLPRMITGSGKGHAASYMTTLIEQPVKGQSEAAPRYKVVFVFGPNPLQVLEPPAPLYHRDVIPPFGKGCEEGFGLQLPYNYGLSSKRRSVLLLKGQHPTH
jgi:hypothetical protein